MAMDSIASDWFWFWFWLLLIVVVVVVRVLAASFIFVLGMLAFLAGLLRSLNYLAFIFRENRGEENKICTL
jgi:hypothetical protein